MNFDQAIAAVAAALQAQGTEIDTDAYDGIIVKKLAATNTLGDAEVRTRRISRYRNTDGHFPICPF